MNSKNITLAFAAGLALVALLLIGTTRNSAMTQGKNLIPITTITHGHGLAVDLESPDKVYIATHHGLILFDSGKLYQVGTKQDDYMGFSPDSTNAQTFHASGHPSAGGNIGFQKSTDGGLQWNTVSQGVDGPVDFHAMAVSPVDSNYVYGWYQGKVQRSVDGGANFEIVSSSTLAVQLVADSKDVKTLYAASPAGQGILVSHDAGVTFSELSPDLVGGPVAGIASDPRNASHMLVFSEKLGGLGVSMDHGITWTKVNTSFDGTVLFVAFSRTYSSIVYALTNTNALYKSANGGVAWMQVAAGQAHEE